jgi:hypothetical protein
MSTKTVADEIKLKAPTWSYEGSRSILQMMDRAQRKMFSQACRNTVFVDPTTGDYPFLPTQAGVYQYTIPDAYRVIGGSAATYNAGTAGVSVDGVTVTLTGASLPDIFGAGDVVTIDTSSINGPPKSYIISSVISTTQFTIVDPEPTLQGLSGMLYAISSNGGASSFRISDVVRMYVSSKSAGIDYRKLMVDRAMYEAGVCGEVNLTTLPALQGVRTSVIFPFDPGATTNMYQYVGLIEPMRLTSVQIPLSLPEEWEYAIIEGSLGYIESYDYGNSQRVQEFEEVICPRFWDKGRGAGYTGYSTTTRPRMI